MTGTSKKNEDSYTYTNSEEDYEYSYDYSPVTTTGNVTTTSNSGAGTVLTHSPALTGATSGTVITTSSGTTAWDFGESVQDKILERLEAIEKRLVLLPELSDEDNTALKDAYDHYKFIEKLCEGEESELGKESK